MPNPAPHQHAGSRIRYGAAASLAVVEAFGLNSMYGEIWRSGFAQTAWNWLNDPNAQLPGSSRPAIRQYFRIPLIDDSLVLANFCFISTIDGSRPEMSLYGLQFGGQLVPAVVVLMIEGLRAGNGNRMLRWSLLWCHLMQVVGYAIVMPLYGCIHLFTSASSPGSSDANRLRSRAPLALQVLIPSFIIGYVIPTILFVYPFSSNFLRQWFCTAWQLYPHLLYACQHVLASRCTREDTQRPDHRPQDQDLKILSKAYGFAFTFAATVQIFVYTVLITVWLFPSLFPGHIAEALTFSRVFKPGPFYSYGPPGPVPDEMHRWFHYDQYVGSTAILIWSLALHLSRPTYGKQTWKGWARLGWNICVWTVIGGPAGAAAKILQLRDEQIRVLPGSQKQKR